MARGGRGVAGMAGMMVVMVVVVSVGVVSAGEGVLAMLEKRTQHSQVGRQLSLSSWHSGFKKSFFFYICFFETSIFLNSLKLRFYIISENYSTDSVQLRSNRNYLQ